MIIEGLANELRFLLLGLVAVFMAKWRLRYSADVS